jgi:hypothetical protein
MNAPVQIRHPETAEALRTLARQEGKTITALVQELLETRKFAKNEDFQQRLAAVREIQKRVAMLPRLEPWPTDDDFYDEQGLPR